MDDIDNLKPLAKEVKVEILIKNTGIIKYKLIDGTYLRFPNPYNGDLNQVRGKSFVIEFEQTS